MRRTALGVAVGIDGRGRGFVDVRARLFGVLGAESTAVSPFRAATDAGTFLLSGFAAGIAGGLASARALIRADLRLAIVSDTGPE